MAQEGTLNVDPMDEGMRRAVEETLAKIDRSWTALIDGIDGVPADRMEEPGVVGEWSVKDVMGHIAYWEAQAMENIHRRAAGEPAREVDWQAINEREATAIRARPLDAVKTELFQTHQHLLDLLRTLPPTDPITTDVCAFVSGDTYEHYDEHGAEIRAWRERIAQ